MIKNILIRNVLKCQLMILVGIFVALAGLMTYGLVYAVALEPMDNNGLINNKLGDNRETKPESGIKIINGEAVGDNEKNLWPVAVVIDNHPDARPTFGLNKASLVYEFPVEGGATRFLAFYTPGQEMINKVEKIGPVRSVRPYFLMAVKEYDALLAHAGGSAEALKDIEKLRINSLEEIAWWGPEYFWRVYSRETPHNLFTSTDKLTQAVVDWKLKDKISSYQSWLFNRDLNNNYRLDLAEQITINFSADKNYQATWQYATSTADYTRRQNGKIYLDGLDNKVVKADDIIIQFVKEEKILDATGRLAIQLTGEGEVWLFRDGVKIIGRWRKGSAEGRTIFYDQSGGELLLKPGKIWVEVVPGAREVKFQ